MIPLPSPKDLQPSASVPIRSEEGREQARLIGGLRKCWRDLDIIVASIPNGGSRNALEAMNLKTQGLLAGMPDLMVVLPFGQIIFIEMKAKKGHLSPAQVGIHCKLTGLGHRVIIAFSAEQALEGLDFILNKETA